MKFLYSSTGGLNPTTPWIHYCKLINSNARDINQWILVHFEWKEWILKWSWIHWINQYDRCAPESTHKSCLKVGPAMAGPAGPAPPAMMFLTAEKATTLLNFFRFHKVHFLLWPKNVNSVGGPFFLNRTIGAEEPMLLVLDTWLG